MDLFAGTDVRGVEKYHSTGEKFIVFNIKDFALEFVIAEDLLMGLLTDELEKGLTASVELIVMGRRC